MGGDEKADRFFRAKCRRKGPTVLLLEGATQPALPNFDTNFENYSWMSYLAEHCFDVFTMDFQGYGMSSHPKEMNDPCNAPTDDQKNFLVPNPLKTTCAASYSQPLESLDTTDDEIDSVVDYIRDLRQDKKLQINLIGWSRGGRRAIVYAANHADEVEKLVLYAPGRTVLPPPNPFSLKINDQASTFAPFDIMHDKLNCPNDFIGSALRDAIWDQVLEGDELGAAWGENGVMRSPGLNPAGYDPSFPSQLTVPTLVVRGAQDTIADAPSTQQLYDDLGSTDKVLLTVNCATHGLVWEPKHMVLLDASLQWLSSGTYDGSTSGTFFK